MKITYRFLVGCYRLLLELIFFLSRPLLWLILPLYRYRGALYSPKSRRDKPILLHCASVGEVNAVVPLINELANKGYPIHINTVTVTGLELIKRGYPDIPSELAPLDIGSLRRRQYAALNPRMLLIVETEIWPMMLDRAAGHNIPIVFINARMGRKSFDKYNSIQSLIRYLSRSVRMVLAQSDDDSKRFYDLLDIPSYNAGNLKYCLSLPIFDPDQSRRKFGFITDDLILVWGSSRPGEEALLLAILPFLKQQHPNLKIIIAPRHPKRCEELEKMLRDTSYRKLSDNASMSKDILLIDSLGHLAEAYAIADLAIVGGSFYDFGGHNPLEPAFYSKAIIIGEYHHSCKASVQKLQQSNAIVVSDKHKLAADISRLLQNTRVRQDMGQRAKIVLTENAAALHNHIKGIEQCLK